MPKHNLFAPTTLSVSAVPGTAAAIGSAVSLGSRQAMQAMSQSLQELKLSERDSLLKALEHLWHEDQAIPEEANGLNLFPDDLRNMLVATEQTGASLIDRAILTPSILASHLLQIPSDVSISINALGHSLEDHQKLMQTHRASSLDRDKEIKAQENQLSANIKNLCNQIDRITDVLGKNVDAAFRQQGQAAQTHNSSVKSSATASLSGTVSSLTLIASVLDSLGACLRELSAVKPFLEQESQAREKNIYEALARCCNSLSQSKNSAESLRALLALEDALLNSDLARDMINQHAVSGPSLTQGLRMMTSLPFIKSLQAVNISFLALSVSSFAVSDNKKGFSENTIMSVPLASVTKDFQNTEVLNHFQNVSGFCELFDEAVAKINNNIDVMENNKTIASCAVGSVRSHSAVLIASCLIPGFIGLFSRELSASVDFTRQDKGCKEESLRLLESREGMSGADLDNLLDRVSALQHALIRAKELGASAPVAMGVSKSLSIGGLIASLNVIAGMYSALKECRTMSKSPSAALILNEEERQKAIDYKNSVIDCNQGSANSSGTGVVSDNLALHQHLQSVMERLAFIHRSYQNNMKGLGDRKDIDSAGKSSIGLTQGNSSGFLLGSLGVLSLIGLQSGISMEALFGGFRYSMETRRISDGVDRINLPNGSKSNVSAASNGSRLTEQAITSNKSASGTHHLGELSFSRSLLVALCQSGAFKAMLKQLIAAQKAQLEHKQGHLDSVLTSDALMPQLHAHILQVLEDAAQGQNPIPGLNADMAQELASASKSSIASAICSHSLFIAPVLQSILAAKQASLVEDKIKNEALSVDCALSNIISQSLNQLQAVCINFPKAFADFEDPIKNSTSGQSYHSTLVTGMIQSCAVSLLCEELFEICLSRSLSLLDKEKIEACSKEKQVLSEAQSALSTAGVKEDSREGKSMSQALSALRLTLSHLGGSLGEVAQALYENDKLLKDNLEIHTSQRHMLQSMSSVFSNCGASLSAMSAVLSNLPLTSAGSIDELRACIHCMDEDLVIEQSHCSEDFSKACDSQSSLISGIGTDCISNIMSTICKLLLQSAVLGSDTSLSIARVMEILSVHPRPDEALALELQRFSIPHGSSNHPELPKQSTLIGTSLAAAACTEASQSPQSNQSIFTIHDIQKAIDERIEGIALLSDPEETEDHVIDLKLFYKLLIVHLNHEAEKAVDDLANRLDKGGISLSSYHSRYGGIAGGRSVGGNSQIDKRRLQGCDDAKELMAYFIDKALTQEMTHDSLLHSFKQRLLKQGQLSELAMKSWQYIVNSVFERLQPEAVRQSIFHPGQARALKVNYQARKEDLLNNWDDLKETAVVALT